MLSLRNAVAVAIVVAAIAVSMFLVGTRPAAQPMDRSTPAPLVRAKTALPVDLRFVVRAQGEVRPRSEIDLVAEVSGKVVETSEALVSGGFFDQGDVLVRIDPTDYELALRRARAEVTRAEVDVETEKAEAEVARREWRALGQGAAPPLVAREPQLADARARLEAARAVLEQARVELERTRITAPFSGRVRNEDVDVGGFIARGNAIARIYSVDVAEVRLPLASDELAYLDLPLGYLDASDQGGPEVQLYAEFGGRRHRWQGRIVRTEGEIDPGSRMVHVVAQVDEPYSKSADDPDRPPLAVGMFVDAEIAGRHVDGVFVLPRGALRGGDRVLVIDEESRLRMRSVRVLRAEEHRVIVGDGLDAGERVCISALEVAVDGMLVRIVEEEADSVPDGTVDGQESGA